MKTAQKIEEIFPLGRAYGRRRAHRILHKEFLWQKSVSREKDEKSQKVRYFARWEIVYYRRISRTRFCLANFAENFVEILEKPSGLSSAFASFSTEIRLMKIASHRKERIFEGFFARRKQIYKRISMTTREKEPKRRLCGGFVLFFYSIMEKQSENRLY